MQNGFEPQSQSAFDCFAVIEGGVSKAEELMSSNKTHKVVHHWDWRKENRYRPGDTVLPVFINSKGKVLEFAPPGEFLYSNVGAKKRYYYFEQVRRRDLSVSEFRERMPSKLKKRIDRAGKVKKEDEMVIRRAFIK